MACVGIFIGPETMSALFNHQLLLTQGESLIVNNDTEDDPELLRLLVQEGLQKSFPGVKVGFLDHYSWLELDAAPEKEDYALVVVQESPMYSRSVH